MNILEVLARPLAETFTVSGQAVTVAAAHNLAWEALATVLAGLEPQELWQLKAMQHVYSPDTPSTPVAFQAEFARRPDEEDS